MDFPTAAPVTARGRLARAAAGLRPWLAAVGACVALARCGGHGGGGGGFGPVGFGVVRAVPEQRIRPAALERDTMAAPGGPMSVRFAAENAAGAANGVASLALESLSLDITPSAEPPGDADCWDFVHEVRVSIESTRADTALPRREIARGGAVGCARTLRLDPVGGVDLKPYADEGYRVVIEMNGVVPDDDVTFGGAVGLYASLL